ncbi:transglycosylase SLT domain-containing protein [Mesorhizobium liriopis]|uniref:transglycosylase SLT domain-containing protein n=1 Tax=Mesorhizobium liriopis TaxID=2953882 RepID=UPI003EBCBD37
MKIRFGLCLLPLLIPAGCTTNESASSAKLTPTPPQTFAMLPDAAPLPGVRSSEVAQAAPVAATQMAYAGASPAASSPDLVRSGSVEVVKQSNNAQVDQLIASYAQSYEVPESLVRRVVKRESNFRPEARNGPYWGLMQILPATARSMGFSGPSNGLLDAETNLKYAVKYLKGAYMVAGGDHDQAVRNYARGYYFDAKRKGMLEAAGLKRSRMPNPVGPAQEPEIVLASAAFDAKPKPATPAIPMPQTSAMAERWDAGIAAVKSEETAEPAATATAALANQTEIPVTPAKVDVIPTSAGSAPVQATVANTTTESVAEAVVAPETVAATPVAAEANPSSTGKGGRVGHGGFDPSSKLR